MELLEIDRQDDQPNVYPENLPRQKAWLKWLSYQIVDSVWQPFKQSDLEVAKKYAIGRHAMYGFCYCLTGKQILFDIPVLQCHV